MAALPFSIYGDYESGNGLRLWCGLSGQVFGEDALGGE